MIVGTCCWERSKKWEVRMPSVLLSHPAFSRTTISRAQIRKTGTNIDYLLKLKSRTTLFMASSSLRFLSSPVLFESKVKVKTARRRQVIYRYPLAAVPHTYVCLLLWIQPRSSCLSCFHPSLSLDNMSCHSLLLSHERAPAPTSQQPLIGRAFPGR